ncbi:MAG: hypothetical protein ACRDWD_13780 [Acidimicrobiia bacterium]
MSRGVRRLVGAVIILLLVGTVALVLMMRPSLEDDQNAVDDAWVPLRAPLVERYDALGSVDEELRAAGGSDRDVTVELTEELDAWREAAIEPDDTADAEAEVEIANSLEGLSARVLATVNASERLRSSQGLTDALATFASRVPEPELVRGYNNAVGTFDDTRTSLSHRLTAAVFGYEARTSLVLAE